MVRLLIAISLAVILIATLLPVDSPASMEETACLVCGTRGVADAVLNVILFAPFGIGLTLAGFRPHTLILGAVLLSAGIEGTQTLIPGRDPSVGDLLFNALGTALGGLLARSPLAHLAPAVPRAARRSLAAALVALAVFTATGLLLQPRLTQSVYYGQWTPQLGHLDWYQGRVLEATAGPLPIPSRTLDDSDAVRSTLQRRGEIRIVGIAGPRTERLASLVSIYDADRREIILVGPDRDDFVYRYHKLAGHLRLDQPDTRLRGALKGIAPGDTLRIAVTPGERRTCIAVNAHRECDLGFTVGSGWTVLLYLETWPRPLHHLASVGWVAILLFPCGLWARRHRETYFAAVLIPLGLLALPSLIGLLPTPPLEWAGMLIGVSAGGTLQAVQRARRR